MVRRRGGTAGSYGLLTSLLAAVVVLLAPAAASAKLVRHELDAGKQRLSPAAIANAEPMELLRVQAGRADAYPAADDGGAPGSVEGRPPIGAALAAGAGPGATGAGFRNFASNAVANPTAYPNSTNGKVIGRIPNLGPYTCSATVVRAKNRSVAFTAGHCVRDPRAGWARRLTFIPAYDRGSQPFGRWEAKAALTTRGWVRRASPNFDYAAIVLRKSRGRKVENAVGSLGLAYNIPAKRKTFRPVGYPFNKADTEVMWECVSTFGGRDPFYRRPGPAPIGVGCDMRGGASGGGWMIPRKRLASVTSFGYDNRPNELYGPKLKKGANRLRRQAGRE
jgi:hypothetical protein